MNFTNGYFLEELARQFATYGQVKLADFVLAWEESIAKMMIAETRTYVGRLQREVALLTTTQSQICSFR
ncbi:hypothetical protein H6P81_018000 [Aristolochia fimbriata]|uniref:Uncharacterized protein n=1 Tax=Aristolochia fimbriata TaxID=158543 RepID=A0AAV7E179_ARIFI|nr:hypothetical protein H6P81_018000 [Aristolochia fimbriata]